MRKILIGLILIVSMSLFAQESENSINKGFRVNLQSEQLDLTVPFFLENGLELAPSIGVIHAEKIGTDLGFGLSIRKYMNNTKVSPFLGIRGGMLLYMPDGDDTIIDYIYGFMGGVEYFFDQHLSVGVEYQVNCAISDEFSLRFGNPDKTNINTASAVSLSIYW